MGLFVEEGVAYKAVEDVDLGPKSDEFYLRANVKAPRMAGLVVKIFVWFLESRILGPLLVFVLKRNNLIHKLVSNAKIEEAPVFVPSHPYEDCTEQQVIELDSNMSPPEKVQQAANCLPSADEKLQSFVAGSLSFMRWTVMDYSKAYASGAITPRTVAERLIAAVKDSCKGPLEMSFFINHDAEDILRQATESTGRYKRGEPISVLDGVPIAIKDEIDCMPYPTTGGTKWLHKLRPCKEDACCIERLRSCGAILIGKTNMHELGAGTSGINPHYGTARNPYDPNRISGGSSSGSAAVVAAGLCPVALGVDGGGSVRMPASLCGVVGLKPTFGCIPHDGVLPLNWTVGMVGILAGTVEDAYLVYAAISDQSVRHIPGTKHPEVKIHYPLLQQSEKLKDIRMAKYGEWFDDCNDEVRMCCMRALERLDKRYGWKTLEVTIPEIETMRLAHYTTIASECNASISSYLEKLKAEDLGWDARVVLSIYRSFSSKEYIKAQKIRNRQLKFHKKILSEVDVIVSPTTGVTAYPLLDDAKETGELDYINGAALVRYSIAGNFLGLPAVTVPIGYDKLGLPVGLQFIGRPWSEATLVHIAHAMQVACSSEYKKPKVFYDLLKKE
ncbi:hypothetical protein MLD38_020445 [Melastoma candidum]|uniref:Uncharacterized protein n=1 Tax=Melastoma candidum TaxID=119954 RepID=A0ACB9QCE4_9MYRT|nr:hypothetical protein MLD38_020445 [Melastoma candidum]